MRFFLLFPTGSGDGGGSVFGRRLQSDRGPRPLRQVMALRSQQPPARVSARPPQSVWDYTRLSDADLLSLVAEDRDQVAFEEFFSRYSRSVYSLMVRQLGDAGWADDVVQEAFISVWRYARSYRAERGSVVGWLYTIARNAGYEAARRRQSRWLAEPPD